MATGEKRDSGSLVAMGGLTRRFTVMLFAAAAVIGLGSTAVAQRRPFLSNLTATRATPVYTTYAAAQERSSFVLDEGYHLRFYDPAQPIEYVTDHAGSWGLRFSSGGKHVYAVSELAAEPVITTSYGDVVRYHYRPFADLRVDVTFLVYSSRLAVQDLTLSNTGTTRRDVAVAAILRGAAFTQAEFASDGSLRFAHHEPADRWTTEHAQPHVTRVRDVLVFSETPECRAALAAASDVDCSSAGAPDTARVLVAQRSFTLRPGATMHWRIVRGVTPADSSVETLETRARAILQDSLEPYVRANEALFERIPAAPTSDPREQLLYWSAFTLLRQVMLPPEGATRFPYYVFSREPQWGWGHAGQVFHESLSMLAYALLDPAGALASQRVMAERQHPDGYIPYRVGPYLTETIPHEGELTASAPWYAWQNWEIYLITRDRRFLRDMYDSSRRFYEWMAAHRDRDRDGLYEWGGHAVLESVRDGDVAVWDEVGWPSNFEALDLNVMLCAEAEALAAMAAELGVSSDAADWRAQAARLRERSEQTFWDEATGFYYHVDRRRNGFSFARPDDLKRREIIGFLPLWAGTASRERADRLIAALTDDQAFWRKHGVPSLAADDPYYNARGYWNGPVWVEWNYLVVRGLLRYGRRDLAHQLTKRVAAGMIEQLEKNHLFWEMYGPDGEWAGHHHTYIWAGLIARMLLDTAAP